MAFSKGFGYEFNFDVPNFDYLEFQPNAGNERHRVVVNGIADLPWGFKASGLFTWASGVPALLTDSRDEARFRRQHSQRTSGLKGPSLNSTFAF